MASEAKLRGNKKHLEKLDDIKIRVPKGIREEYKAHAESRGISLNGKKMSLNALVCELVEKDMQEQAKSLGMSLNAYRNSLIHADMKAEEK